MDGNINEHLDRLIGLGVLPDGVNLETVQELDENNYAHNLSKTEEEVSKSEAIRQNLQCREVVDGFGRRQKVWVRF
jgi:hypothetical protein